VNRLARVNQTAARKVEAYAARVGLNRAEDVVRYAYSVASQYGEAAAALACEMYDQLAAAQNADVPPAIPAETATYDEAARATYGAIRDTPNMVGAPTGRFVKRSAADTMLQNAMRDGAEWAWIPQSGACAFCLALASQGWQNASKAVMQGKHAKHIHNNCRCEFAVRFDGISDVEGYEELAAALKEKFDSFEGTPEERIKAWQREIDEENRAAINAQKRSVALRNAGVYESYDYKSCYAEYLDSATPGKGKMKHRGRKFKNREYENMKLIHQMIGGDIEAPKEINKKNKSNPDYRWRGHLWEEKEPNKYTRNSVDQNTRTAIAQIQRDPGGIVLDIGQSMMELEQVHETINRRLRRSANFNCDVILIRDGEIVDICRHKK